MSLFDAFSKKCLDGGSHECRIAECAKRGCVNKRLDEHARAIKNEAAFHHLLAAAQRSILESNVELLSIGIREALSISHDIEHKP